MEDNDLALIETEKMAERAWSALRGLADAVEKINEIDDSHFVLDVGLESHMRFKSAMVFGWLLMQNLDAPFSGADTFSGDEKVFWLAVAQEIGPDWIAKFRRIGAFMAQVEKA